MAVIKYTERNAARAKLVKRCEDWRWGSAWRRIRGTEKQKKLLDPIPVELPEDYIDWINSLEIPEELDRIRQSVNKSIPYGRDDRIGEIVAKYHLETTLRKVGRPKKDRP